MGTHLKCFGEVIQMSTNNICFYREIRKNIPYLSPNTLPGYTYKGGQCALKIFALLLKGTRLKESCFSSYISNKHSVLSSSLESFGSALIYMYVCSPDSIISAVGSPPDWGHKFRFQLSRITFVEIDGYYPVWKVLNQPSYIYIHLAPKHSW